ncbi:MAG: class I SAM-dependent methyltransferase [Acidimicrobiales bacterium]
MNEGHLVGCASLEWAELVENELLPWAIGEQDLGDDVLEVGAGPGLTTDVLAKQVVRLTAVESDDALAANLAERLAGTNVEVVHADATALPFGDGRFSGAGCFTMLHHVPSAELQDRLFAEVCRVLRPGGVVVGLDSTESPALRADHDGDVFVPVDPTTLAARLETAGLTDVTVEATADRFRFLGRRKRSSSGEGCSSP